MIVEHSDLYNMIIILLTLWKSIDIEWNEKQGLVSVSFYSMVATFLFYEPMRGEKEYFKIRYNKINNQDQVAENTG